MPHRPLSPRPGPTHRPGAPPPHAGPSATATPWPRVRPPRDPGTPAPDRSTATPGRPGGSRRGWPRTAGPPPTARPRPLRPVRRPQDLLVELPHAGLGDLRDELDPVGQPPLREVRLEVLDQLLLRGGGPLLQHHARQGPLAPSLV